VIRKLSFAVLAQ